MKFTCNHPTISRTLLVRSLAVALLAATTASFASAGEIYGIGVTPGSVLVNEPVTLKLGVAGGKEFTECAASWSVRDQYWTEVAGGQATLTRIGIDSAEYNHVFKITKPGVYNVTAQKGLATRGQTTCDGYASTSLIVKAMSVSSQPVDVKPPSTTPINPVNPITKINPIPTNPGNPGGVRKP